MRGQHHAAGDGGRLLRLQVGIAALQRIGADALSALGVDERAQDREAGGEQFLQVWGADVERPGAAQADIVIDLAGETQLPGLDQAGGGIAGDAAGGVEVQRLDDVVLEQRRVHFQEAFLHIVLAGEGGEVAHAPVHGQRIGVGGDAGAFLAVFAAERHRDRTGGQRPVGRQLALHRAGDHVFVQDRKRPVAAIAGRTGDVIDRGLAKRLPVPKRSSGWQPLVGLVKVERQAMEPIGRPEVPTLAAVTRTASTALA